MTYYETYNTLRVLRSFFAYARDYSTSADLVYEALLDCVNRGRL